MFRKIKSVISKRMIRPFIYMCFSRLVMTLFVILLFCHFVSSPSRYLQRQGLMILACLLYLFSAWISYLRLNGMKFPIVNLKLKRKHTPVRAYGDMMDYVDEGIYSFDELEEEEKKVCVLLADLLLAIVCGIISLLI